MHVVVWEKSKKLDTWFVVTPQNATNYMFSESACLKTNFGTYLEFWVQAVAEKFLGKVWLFCAFPSIHAPTKIAITFVRLNRFYRMIACFKLHSKFLKILNFTLLKIFEWSKFVKILKWNFSRISRRIFLKIRCDVSLVFC
jgi:hypothetical protein